MAFAINRPRHRSDRVMNIICCAELTKKKLETAHAKPHAVSKQTIAELDRIWLGIRAGDWLGLIYNILFLRYILAQCQFDMYYSA